MSHSPYAAFGTVASGDRFLGRERELSLLIDRVLVAGSSAAVVGLPRVGKTSLAGRLTQYRDALSAKHVAWINVATCSSAAELLDQLSTLVASADGQECTDSSSLQLAYRQVTRLLRSQTRRNERAVVVFDEFDAVRHWTDGAQGLHMLRELICDPDRLGFAGLFLCRRSLDRLEVELSGISTFAGVCQQVFLGALEPAALEEMNCRAGTAVMSAAELSRMTGGHPFLAERVLHARFVDSQDDCQDYYTSLGRFLIEENLEGRLVALRAGAPIPGDVEVDSLLTRYGLWTAETGPFCEPFGQYLDHRSLDLDVWAEFGRAERAVRRLLASRLTATFGPQWLEGFEHRYAQAGAGIVAGARHRRELETKKWPTANQLPLIDYTYPGDLLVVLTVAWSELDLSGKYRDKKYWELRLTTLARVRTPLGHHRSEALPPEELALALYHCAEIVSAVEAIIGVGPTPLGT